MMVVMSAAALRPAEARMNTGLRSALIPEACAEVIEVVYVLSALTSAESEVEGRSEILSIS